MKLVYSKEALDDLQRLRNFIAEHNPAAPTRIAEELIKRIENLCLFPHMGVSVEQAPKPAEIRDMVFRKYIVRYSVHEQAVAILRVWHHLEQRNDMPDSRS